MTACPTCGNGMEHYGTGSLAYGDADAGLIADGDVYGCMERHIWVNLDPPVWAFPKVG